MKAVWNGATLAESDDTVVVEGNHYFPAESIVEQHFLDSPTHTNCAWKGQASYRSVKVGDDLNADAAWYYPEPKDAAVEIRGRYAFWNGVTVEP
jgi:uncharacterized protein (DUF427 family)